VFSWDAGKALSNLKKHGVSFEEAATVFSDPEGRLGRFRPFSSGASLQAARALRLGKNPSHRLYSAEIEK
jgi:uncharacterized DUF497 family protein